MLKEISSCGVFLEVACFHFCFLIIWESISLPLTQYLHSCWDLWCKDLSCSHFELHHSARYKHASIVICRSTLSEVSVLSSSIHSTQSMPWKHLPLFRSWYKQSHMLKWRTLHFLRLYRRVSWFWGCGRDHRYRKTATVGLQLCSEGDSSQRDLICFKCSKQGGRDQHLSLNLDRSLELLGFAGKEWLSG